MGLLLTCGLAQAQVTPEAARKVLAAHQDAVVLIEGVLTAEMLVNGTRAGDLRENRISLSGFIVDHSGLVVVSSFHLNPLGVLAGKPTRMERGGQSYEIQVSTHLDSLILRLRDRSEVPVRIVIEDPDLGLTLLGPIPGDDVDLPTFHPVPLDESVIPLPSTQYLVVDRGAATFRNEWILESGTISGVLTKPRTRYLQDLGRRWMFLGAPFFDLEGRLLGLGMLEIRPPRDPSTGTWDSAPIPVITPAADIRELVNRTREGDDRRENPVPSNNTRPASDQRLTELSRKDVAAVLKTAGNAVVVIEGTVKYMCGHCAEEHEEEIDEIGTIVDPAGLIVMAGDGDSEENQYREQQLRCVLVDGTAIPVRILLHDDDLLLTVLAPVPDPNATLAPAFSALAVLPETRAEILEDVIVLGRLGRENRHALSVAIGHIVARATQPRLFYQIFSMPPALSDYGLPVLTKDGAFLGVTSADPQDWDTDADASMNPFSQQTGAARIVPAVALLDVLQLARTAGAADPGQTVSPQAAP